jgi:hypothetical protein
LTTPAQQAARAAYVVALVERQLGPVEVVAVLPRPKGKRPR